MANVKRLAALLVLLVPAFPVLPAAGQEGGADLSVALEAPTETPLAGDEFTVSLKVTNAGPSEAIDAVASVGTGGAEFVSADDPSCAYTDYPPPYAEPTEPSGPSRPGYAPAVECRFASLAPGATKTVQLTLRRTSAMQTYLSASVYAAAEDPNYENNYAEAYLAPDTSNPADLSLTKSAPGDVSVGETFRYTLTVSNAGPSAGRAITLVDPLPYEVEFVGVHPARPGDSCTYEEGSGGGVEPMEPYPAYRQVTCELGELAPGADAVVEIEVVRAGGHEVYNSASIYSSHNYDADPEDDYAYAMLAADPSVTSDLALAATGPDAVAYGGIFDVTFEVTNRGPSAAPDVYLSSYVPDGLSFVAVSDAQRCAFNDYSYSKPGEYAPGAPPEAAPEDSAASPVYVGGGSIDCSFGLLGVDETAAVTVTFERTSARDQWLGAWTSTSNHEPAWENNYAELHLAPDLDKAADVALTMEAPADAEVGDAFTYTLTATNAGPKTAEDVVVFDPIPYEVDLNGYSTDTGTCSAPEQGTDYETAPGSEPVWGYREVRCELGDLEPGATAVMTIEVTRREAWEIYNGAWVWSSSYDPNYENDYAWTVVDGEPYPGVCPAEPEGGEGRDDIVVSDCAVSGGGGADDITVLPPSSPELDVAGGRGNDVMTILLEPGAQRREVTVRGGPGADRFVVIVAPGTRRFALTILGGGGNDAVTVQQALDSRAAIVFRGGRGADSLSPDAVSSDMEVAAGRGLVVWGGPGRDSFVGGPAADALHGMAGRDHLDGGAGDDLLDGGRERDRCVGGTGRDTARRC